MKTMTIIKLFFLLSLTAFILLLIGCSTNQTETEFQSNLPKDIERTWIGPEYWANPLQDWQLNNGRAECITSGGDRNLFLLTHELSDEPGTVKMSVNLGRLPNDSQVLTQGWVGFKIGIRGEFDDYRDNAVHGIGFPVGITTAGRLFIGDRNKMSNKIEPTFQNISLKLIASPEGEQYNLTLSAFDIKGNLLSRVDRTGINGDWLHGGVALVCSNGKLRDMPESRPLIDDDNWGFRPGTARGGNVRFWFADWKLSGTKVRAYPNRRFGPILFTQYTLSKGIVKMTAQLPPIGSKDGQTVQLQIQQQSGNWQMIKETKIDPMARTATFRIENWDSTHDIPYRLVYKLCCSGEKLKEYHYEGTIRRQPWDKEEFVVAAFTGNNDLGFPNNDIIKQLNYQNPDLLFFSGDQIYEGVGGYGVQRSPVEKACLDYLRKWYILGWGYGDLMRNRPTVCIPDDHDVYHGNIWGAGGKATPPDLFGSAAQDEGGYKMPADWVNMVQRTQTSHLPDPYDPTPVEQGIGVYYCDMNYAGISFAILEDRKFKSAPKTLLPEANIDNGWAQNKNFNPKTEADVEGAVLLGERQLKFLREWAEDWRHHTWMKVVLSQTIFSNVATLPKEEAMHDRIVPKLRVLKAGEYPPDDIPVSDMDSNGWPQSGRNRALREIRKAFGFHIAGDQHLGSTIQYGIDDWNDAGFAFCVPAVSNVWPRRWFPSTPGNNRKPDAPKYTGDFEDGFGNKMTVYAVSNPVFTGLKPEHLYDRATGYGIVRFNRTTHDIIVECWPRLSDPSKTEDGQYPGWPIKINQQDNYARQAAAYLPTLTVEGMSDPVVQVIDESDGKIVYTLRIKESKFQPKVFKQGTYTIKVIEPDKDVTKEFNQITARIVDKGESLKVRF